MLKDNIIDYTNGGNAIVLMDNPASTLVLNNQFINTSSDPTGLNAVLDVSSSATYSGNSINGTIVPTISVSSTTVKIPDWAEYVNLTSTTAMTISSIQTNSQNSIVGTGIGYLTMTNSGSGYPSTGSGITVTISDPTGSGFSNPGAKVYNVGTSTGNIQGFSVGSRGFNYTSPSVVISSPSSGTTATATAQIGIPWTNNRKISIVNVSSSTLTLSSSSFVSPINKSYALAPFQSTSIIYVTSQVGTQLVSTAYISDNSRGIATDISINNTTMTIATPTVDISTLNVSNLNVANTLSTLNVNTLTAETLDISDVYADMVSVTGAFFASAVDSSSVNSTIVEAAASFQIGAGSTRATWTSGSGVPTSTQPVGSLYSNVTGSTGSRLYVSAGSGHWSAVAGV